MRLSTLVVALLVTTLWLLVSTQSALAAGKQGWKSKTCTTTAAKKAKASSRVLFVIHCWVGHTRAKQRAVGRCCAKYYYKADKRSTSLAKRWEIAARWYDRYMSVPEAPQYGVPAWFVEDMRCISRHEEYGFPDEGGHNTIAGYFGMPSSPSMYPGSAYAVATYGDYWLAIPFAAQLPIAYAELLKYGWYPTWSTAPGCGLA